MGDFGGYVTIREAASILGMTANAVYLHIRNHHVPVKRAGRTIMLRLEDLGGMRVTLANAMHQPQTN